MSRYPDVIHKGRHSVFPERLQLALEAFKEQLVTGQLHAGLVKLVIAKLDILPADAVTQAELEMPVRA